MNDIEQRLKDEATRSADGFSPERHERLVEAIKSAPDRIAEPPLRPSFELRALGVVALIAIAGLAGYFTLGDRAPKQPGHDFGAPLRVAERSIVDVQFAASTLDDEALNPMANHASKVLRFVVDQISVTRSLAIPPREKPRT